VSKTGIGQDPIVVQSSAMQELQVASLDPAGAQPLWRQVADAIAHDIATGRLQPGERLPSERALAEQLGLSRVTARRALQALVEDGLVQPSAGRGWFVSSGPVSEAPNQLESFSEMARARGLTPTAEVLRREVRPATFEEAETLAIAPGADVFEIERLRMLDGLPVGLDRSRLPLRRARQLLDVDFATASLYEALRSLCGLRPERAEVSVGAALADARQRELLDLGEVGAVLQYEQRTYDQENRPVEIGNCVYRGDRYRFRASLAERI
jgi:GntR family transcriptional regulator